MIDERDHEFPAKTMSSIEHRIRAFLREPLSPTGEQALAAFIDLPNMNTWHPENVHGSEVDLAFDFGLAFSLLGQSPSSTKLRSSLAKGIQGNAPIVPSEVSEVHAAALASTWGLRPIFVPRSKNGRTPDIECTFSSGAKLDIEVIRADRRHRHKNLNRRLQEFIGALHAGDVSWNIACFIEDASDTSDVNAAFEAAAQLQPGESAECHGRWHVIAVSSQQMPNFNAEYRTLTPSWWDRNAPTFSHSSTLIGGPILSNVLLTSHIPITEYINPIKKKAERNQARSERHTLIALDATMLPRAEERLPTELGENFRDWPHLSGVLIFDPRFWSGCGKKTYFWTLVSNPHADMPLPPELLSKSGETHETNFFLSNE